jgi:hypothetical protein
MEDFTLPNVGARFKKPESNSQRAFFKPPYSCCPPFWADVVNSCWFVPALAHLVQISPKNFISP